MSEQQPDDSVDVETEVTLSTRDAWKAVPKRERRWISIAVLFVMFTLFVLPVVTIGVAYWKYKQEIAARGAVVVEATR